MPARSELGGGHPGASPPRTELNPGKERILTRLDGVAVAEEIRAHRFFVPPEGTISRVHFSRLNTNGCTEQEKRDLVGALQKLSAEDVIITLPPQTELIVTGSGMTEVSYPSGTFPIGEDEWRAFKRPEESGRRGFKIVCGPDTPARRDAVVAATDRYGIRPEEYEAYWESRFLPAEDQRRRTFDGRIAEIRTVQEEQRGIAAQDFLRRSGIEAYLNERNRGEGYIDPSLIIEVGLELFSTTRLPETHYDSHSAIYANLDLGLFSAVASRFSLVTQRRPAWRDQQERQT